MTNEPTTHRHRRRPRLLASLGLLVALLVPAGLLTAYAGGATAETGAEPSTTPVPTAPSGSPTASASESPQSDSSAGPGTTSNPSPSADSFSDTGQEVFLRDCAWCHGNDGEGTQNGPSLADDGGETVDFYLRTGRMPLSQPDARVERGPVAYSDDVIRGIEAYVAQLGGSGDPVPELGPGDPVKGRELFLTNCAACHSSSGTGMIVPGGNWAPELWETHNEQVAEAIRIGPGPMPKFSDKQLEDQEVDDIVSYVEQLGDPQVKSGAGIEQYGPIIEGLLVWLVGLPALLLVIRFLGKRAGS